MDTLTPRQRSRQMARIKNRDTKPELVVSKMLRSLGVGFVTHPANMPGKPDMVLRKRRLVVFVHGCFWHRHSCRDGRRLPKTRVGFWTAKLERNRLRDARTSRSLRADGWRVLVIWECQTRDQDRLRRRLLGFLDDS